MKAKKLKRLTALILSFIMMLAVAVPGMANDAQYLGVISASTDVTVRVEPIPGATFEPGTDFQMAVSIVNPTGRSIGSISFLHIDLPTDYVEWADTPFEAGSISTATSLTLIPPSAVSPYGTFFSFDSAVDFTGEGHLLTLNLEVRDDADPGFLAEFDVYWRAESGGIQCFIGGGQPVSSVITAIPAGADVFEVTVEGSHAGAQSGAGEFPEGLEVTVRAGEQDDYIFTHWTSDPAVVFVGGTETNPVGVFIMPDEDVVVTAHWDNHPYEEYPVTLISAATSATQSRDDARYGHTVEIFAGELAGHRFVRWEATVGNVTFANATSPTTTFVMPHGSVTIQAVFVAQHSVTVNGHHAGVNSGAGIHDVGATVVISAGTQANHGFTGWTVVSGGVTLANSASPITTFVMPNEPVEVTAGWEAQGGAAFPFTLRGISNAAYTHARLLDGFFSGGNDFPGGPLEPWAHTPSVVERTITGPTTLSLILANARRFNIDGNTRGVRVTVHDDGSVTAQGGNFSWDGSAFNANANGQISHIPAQPGVVFVSFGPGTPAGHTAGSPPTGPATFAVTVAGGHAGATGAGNYAENAIVGINAGVHPEHPNWIFDGWEVTAGTGVTFADANSPITHFTMPAGAVTVNATWVMGNQYNLTTSVNGNGTVTATPNDGLFFEGDTVTVTATPATGHRFVSWAGSTGLSPLPTTSSFTFDMPGNDVNLIANFELIPEIPIVFACPVFEDYVRYWTLGGHVGNIYPSNVAGVTIINADDVTLWNISSLGGIEHFANLEMLLIISDVLTNVNISGLPELWYIRIVDGSLATVTLSNLPSLESLHLDNNELDTLNLSGINDLTHLSLSGNNLDTIDVSAHTNLTVLHIDDNNLTELDVSNNTQLTSLTVNGNQLSELDVSGLTELMYLEASDNYLTELDISQQAALVELHVSGNWLTGLDVSSLDYDIFDVLNVQNNIMASVDDVLGWDDLFEGYDDDWFTGPPTFRFRSFDFNPQRTFTLTVTGGTGSGTFPHGASVTASATVAAGYEFVSWTTSGAALTAEQLASETVTFNMPANDVTLTANFAQVRNLTVLEGGYGATADGTRRVGATVNITPGTLEGFAFAGWTAVGVTLDPMATSFVMPSVDVTLTATWDPIQTYLLTVTGGTGGGNFPEGARVTASAIVASGYEFDGWEATGITTLTAEQLASETVVFYMPGNDVTLVASVAPVRNLTVLEGGDGATADGTHRVGATVNITPGTRDGHVFTGWETNPVDLTSPMALYFVMPNEDVTITATWEAVYLLTAPGGYGGYFPQGARVTASAIVAYGYEFDGWTATGITLTAEQLASETVVFYMPANDVTLVANVVRMRNLTVLEGGVGATTSGTHRVGATVNITPGTRAGYVFDGWDADGVDLAAMATSFVMPNNDVTITALWDPILSPILTSLIVPNLELNEAQSATVTTAADVIVILNVVRQHATVEIANNTNPSIIGDGLVLTWSFEGGAFCTSPGSLNTFNWSVEIPDGLEVADGVATSGTITVRNFDPELLPTPTLLDLSVDVDVTPTAGLSAADILALLNAATPDVDANIENDTDPTIEPEYWDIAWELDGTFNPAPGATNTFRWTITPPYGLYVPCDTILTGTITLTNYVPAPVLVDLSFVAGAVTLTEGLSAADIIALLNVAEHTVDADVDHDTTPTIIPENWGITWTLEGTFNPAPGATNTFRWTITPPNGLNVPNVELLTGTIPLPNYTPQAPVLVDLSFVAGTVTLTEGLSAAEIIVLLNAAEHTVDADVDHDTIPSIIPENWDITWTLDDTFDPAPGATNTFRWTIIPPQGLEVPNAELLTGTITLTNPGGGIDVGDLTGNGRISIMDVALLRTQAMGMGHTLTATVQARIAAGAGNVSGDSGSNPDIADVVLLRTYVMGMGHTLHPDVQARLAWHTASGQ